MVHLMMHLALCDTIVFSLKDSLRLVTSSGGCGISSLGASGVGGHIFSWGHRTIGGLYYRSEGSRIWGEGVRQGCRYPHFLELGT